MTLSMNKGARQGDPISSIPASTPADIGAAMKRARSAAGSWRDAALEVRLEPLGVVAVIAPWNHPLQLSLVPLVSALVAGNVVLLKPSELTPSVGQLIEALAKEAGLPSGVLQVLQGGGDVGRRLIAEAPDSVFFTGSVAINDVLKNIGNPSTPFGGVKQSGFGRYHGPEGLRAFRQPKTVMSNPQLFGREPNWFPYGESVYHSLKTLIHTLHSDAPKLEKLGQLASGVRSALFGQSKD